MPNFKKMYVLPEELLTNLNAQAKANVTPEMRTMGRLSKEMSDLLTKHDMTDDQIMGQYEILLQRYLDMHRSQKE